MRPTLVMAALALLSLHAQPADRAYKFEVATIKPSSPEARGTSVNVGTNTFQLRNASVRWMIQYAYTIQRHQLAGGPDWTRDLTFDVTAKDEELTPEEMKASNATIDGRARLRLRALLEERFGLKLRSENRELTVYALIVDRGGNKLTPTVRGRGTIYTTSNGPRRVIRGDGLTLARIAESLAVLDRPVIDETGLDGLFDFELKWSDAMTSDEPEPSIFTAVREQLGLRLESKRRMMPVTVVDSVQKPSEN